MQNKRSSKSEVKNFIKAYRNAEMQAVEKLSYAETRVHSPISFLQANFPTKLEPATERQLYKFSDIMSELSSRKSITETLYSDDELKSLQVLQKTIYTITNQNTLMGPLRQIPIYRAIHSLDPDKRCRILEIGPGSGHLGAMLLNDGYSYSAVEITESLFIWCAVLFQEVDKPKFQIHFSDTYHPDQCRNGLYSWWNYATWWKNVPKFDIVIVEAALGEMNPMSMYYLIKLTKIMLERSQQNGALIFSGIGEPRQMAPNQIQNGFAKYGLNGKVVDGISFYSIGETLDLNCIKPVGSGNLKRLKNYELSQYNESYDFFDFLELVRE